MQLRTAQTQLRARSDSIKELIAYYQKGVLDEQDKIGSVLARLKTNDLKKALRDNRISLSMQAIQRRKVYQAKLAVPLGKLEALSEELLYLERKARLLTILSSGISALSEQAFEQEVASALERQSQESANLSIDHIEAESPAYDFIWGEVLKRMKEKGQASAARTILTDKAREIGSTICRGDFDDMGLLTAID
jgi:hypothetical protein